MAKGKRKVFPGESQSTGTMHGSGAGIRFTLERTGQDGHMAVDEVIFLGAGASAAEGAPVQKDLFSAFFRMDSRGRNPASIERLRRFFKQFFGIDITEELDGIAFPSFEETPGVLEIAMDRGESFRGYSAITHAPYVQTIREDLIYGLG